MRRRGILTLLLLLLLGGAAWLITRRCLTPSSPAGWLCAQYDLGPNAADEIKKMEQAYGTRCGPWCGAMCEANARLETLALGSGSVTPELRAAVAEAGRIRTETRLAMLEHFYETASRLPPEKRRDYLLRVLPLVIDSCGSRK